jgi:hypothetical protein
MKTKKCGEADRKGRARKARAFAEAAHIVEATTATGRYGSGSGTRFTTAAAMA